MKVLYDHQIFSSQKFGGISRYFVELMSNLPEDIDFNNSLVLSENEYLKNATKGIKRGINKRIPGAYRLNRLKSSFDILSGRYDLFHPTYYNPYFLKHLKRPFVVTVYDMIHELFSGMFPQTDHSAENKKECIRSADRIIAISENTKNDIIKLYDVNPDKIDVVLLGYSMDATISESVKGCPKNYILFTGQRGLYKNFERFIKAFAEHRKSHPDINLVCTGQQFNESEQQLMSSLGLEKHVKAYFATDAQLKWLYQNALCFVFPSLYEGFGIPILEAFSANCPLLLSNTSCFPEIADDGGLYFDPYSIDSITEAMNNVADDRQLRENLIQKGSVRLKDFSWQKMANETAETYRKIIL